MGALLNSYRTRSRSRTPIGRTVALSIALALALAGCSTGADETPDESAAAPEDPSTSEQTEEPGEGEPPPAAEADPDEGPDDGSEEPAEGEAAEESDGPQVDPAEVGADELGVVPVMMYHQIREDGGSEWDMTPEEFRAELVRLFDSGYVPVRAVDMVRGNIDIPAGASPVVLTFDDSPRNQARLDDDGNMAEDTAMAILIDVAEDYDDVEPLASLYLITSSMFGAVADVPDIVTALHDLGMELGNHTHTHANLRSLDPAGVQDELARAVVEITDIVPDAEVVTLTLPFGISPEERELAGSGSSSEYGEYTNEGVFLVGDRPSPSPFHVDFQPLAIPRIKTMSDPSQEFTSSWWLDQLDAAQSWRPYVSDGDPSTISFPADREDELHPDLADRANPY